MDAPEVDVVSVFEEEVDGFDVLCELEGVAEAIGSSEGGCVRGSCFEEESCDIDSSLFDSEREKWNWVPCRGDGESASDVLAYEFREGFLGERGDAFDLEIGAVDSVVQRKLDGAIFIEFALQGGNDVLWQIVFDDTRHISVDCSGEFVGD